jgi:sarcosine oxidase
LNRRPFLKGAVAGLGVLTVGLRSGPAVARARNPDVAVIGAGVFGVWTALSLRRRGASVTLIDAAHPGHPDSGSGGPTRMVQTDTDTSAYIRSTVAAFPKWKEAEALSGEKFLHEIGRLRIELDDKHLERARQRQANLKGFGVLDTEILDGDEVRRRWPQIRGEDVAFASFNGGGPGGSALLAAKSCRALARIFTNAGGVLAEGTATPMVSSEGKLTGLSLDSGERVVAGQYVFACGWHLPRLFPELLQDRIVMEGRDVFYYDVGPGQQPYTHSSMPAWSVPAQSVYGFPAIDGEGFKVAPSYDPKKSADLAADMRKFTDHRFPGLAGRELATVRKCKVDLTIDYDFIVDRHPRLANAVLVGGGSGHGFKHGPSVGEDAARLVLGETRDEEFARLYALDPRKFDASQKTRFDDK